jgi:hypothetical protein
MSFFGQDRAIAIAEALKVNWALQLLDPTSDKIAGIGDWRHWRRWCSHHCWRELNLSDNDIGPDSPIANAGALKVNQTLLLLISCGIGLKRMMLWLPLQMH